MSKAISTGDTKRVALLLKSGIAADGTELDGTSFSALAAMVGQAEVFMALVAAGADVSEPELLSWSVDGNGGRGPVSSEIVFYLLENVPDLPSTELDAALRFACVNGNPEIVKALLGKGADPNGYDADLLSFPLLNAVQEGHEEIVEMLVASGADPGKFTVKELDDKGSEVTVSTLVERARTLGNANIVQALQQAKAT